MCGIIGLISSTSVVQKIKTFETALKALQKRGPDYSNYIPFDQAIFGHARLSIIDTSSAAHQPMEDASNRYSIVFNGEIFNFKQLKQTYLQEHLFTSNSDTEVVLQLYILLGEKALELLDGFFAIAIYDKQTKQAFIARDRFGKKPLYYYTDEQHFYFASETKSLLPFGLNKELNFESIYTFFQLNYVPQNTSIFKHVNILQAGCYMTIDADLQINIQQYYSTQINIDHSITYPQAQQKVEELLLLSVEKRLIADVPLGAFLSGGIDSSVIVALASQFQKNLNTFSVGFKDNPYFDETGYAQLVADKYKTNHTIFSLGTTDFLNHVIDVLDYFDEPFADPSAIPQFILSMETRKHCTVALSGDGGDEVFAGYTKHDAERKAKAIKNISPILKLGKPIINLLPQGRDHKITDFFRKVNRFVNSASLTAKERYWNWASFHTIEDTDQLFTEQTTKQINKATFQKTKFAYTQLIDETDFNTTLLADMHLVLAGDMLVKVDRMSMANSLEVRSPFLDHHLVDYAFTLPTEFKINSTLKKRIVQDTFRKYLPEQLYNRPKQGFEIPLNSWFKNELWSMIDNDLLSDQFIKEQGIFNLETIQQYKKQLKTNAKIDISWRIWSLITFQYWYKKYYL